VSWVLFPQYVKNTDPAIQIRFNNGTITAVVKDIRILEWPDNRNGPGTYLRTPKGEFKSFFDPSTIKTDVPEAPPAHGTWM
jgi:hypothetical protein